MNNLRKSALLRWNKKLKEDIARIPRDKKSMLKKVALCGFLAGDGSVQVRKGRKGDNYYHYQLDFFPDDEQMLNSYLIFIQDIYKLKPFVTKRDNVYNARLSQKFIVLDLLRFCKFGVYKWGFPNKLFKTKIAKILWLKAFFSAEAYVGKKVIKIQSVNIRSIKKVMKLLSELKIKSNYYEYQSKNNKHSKVGMIFINDRKSRVIYYNKIGFWHNRKMTCLKESLGL